jgi:hypothetical protein
MLLSTDWFFGWWQTVRLSAPVPKRSCVQKACREIVRNFMGTAKEYWLISFDPTRLARTRREFFDALDRCRLGKAAIARLEEIAQGAAVNDAYDVKTTPVLASLTRHVVGDLIADSIGVPAQAVTAKVEEVWNAREEVEMDFEKLCLTSESEWDRFIRSTTPDLPMALADYLSEELVTNDRFVRFWNAISSKLSVEEKRELLDWYVTAARSLTGEEFKIPQWMTS